MPLHGISLFKTRQGSRSWPEACQDDLKGGHPVEPALISLPQYDPVWGSCSGILFGGLCKGSRIRKRYTLKTKDPLIAVKKILSVIGLPSSTKITGSSFRRYASKFFVLGKNSVITEN